LEVVQEAEDGLEEEEADYYGAEDGVGCVVELFDVSDAIWFWGERYVALMLALSILDRCSHSAEDGIQTWLAARRERKATTSTKPSGRKRKGRRETYQRPHLSEFYAKTEPAQHRAKRKELPCAVQIGRCTKTHEHCSEWQQQHHRSAHDNTVSGLIVHNNLARSADYCYSTSSTAP
jgi:hypothetical protein